MTDTGGGRRLQAEERREQILDAALRVFSEKGYSGASVRDIAREIGVAEGLLYHYFESKERLMQACWDERCWSAHLERILSRAEGVPLPEVLREMLSAFLADLYDQAPQVRMFAAEMQYSAELAESLVRRIEQDQSGLHAFLRARQASGELRSDAHISTVAGLLMGSAYSLFLLWGRLPPEAWARRAEEWVPQAVETVLQGAAPHSL